MNNQQIADESEQHRITSNFHPFHKTIVDRIKSSADGGRISGDPVRYVFLLQQCFKVIITHIACSKDNGICFDENKIFIGDFFYKNAGEEPCKTDKKQGPIF